MPTFSFLTTDVFTSTPFGGNQLAVFADARGIPERAMQPIAREFNFSETTFVLPPSDPRHTRAVRIFTPGGELQFAGHPTVGTAFALAWLGLVPLREGETAIVLEEGVGPVPVSIRSKDGKTPDFATLSVAQLPQVGPQPPGIPALARALGLDPGDLLSGEQSPQGLSCGTPFLFVPVRDRAALGRCRVRADEFEAVMGKYWTKEVFVFCDDPELQGSTHRARMFAPLIGVAEDPATGSACAAFGGYLANRDARRDGTLRWVIEQGFEMGRPSIMELQVDKKAGQLTGVRVGGNSVLITRGELTLY
ncbi:MAG TPA: PhzF family phenazine biosynthesis protein [Gemmatimonadaceae bacterium]|nr:PhzF family phenazine biosynthesis protein [Gemmatimonadaceae bacterium]